MVNGPKKPKSANLSVTHRPSSVPTISCAVSPCRKKAPTMRVRQLLGRTSGLKLRLRRSRARVSDDTHRSPLNTHTRCPMEERYQQMTGVNDERVQSERWHEDVLLCIDRVDQFHRHNYSTTQRCQAACCCVGPPYTAAHLHSTPCYTAAHLHSTPCYR